MTVNVWDGIKLVFSGVFTIIGGLFAQFGTTIKLYFGALWEGLKAIVSVAAGAVVGLVTGLWNGIKGLFS